MKQLNYDQGKIGEAIAADHLASTGYKIIERNFHTRFGEIDLVAARGGRLCFVEVKLKVGEDFGKPEEMIDERKLKKVFRMAQLFLQNNPEVAKTYPLQQIDAVCIVLNEDKSVKRVSHYESIGA